ncbi:MAG TPA: LysR substrate-binding domain-containing protein [Stellaceae bacterium]
MTALRLDDSHTMEEPSRSRQDGEPPAAPRSLPPLDALRFFEAAARHLSFSKAGDELHVAEGAVNHRILALEEALGIPLFRRLPRHLELTANGERLARGIRDGFDHIARAVGGLEREVVAGPLAVGMPSSLAARWLPSRLARFTEENPGIGIQILTGVSPADLRNGDVEVAVVFDTGNHPDLAVTPLMPDHVFPVCSPRLLAQHGPVLTPEDLLRLPLLIDATAEQDGSGADWRSWLARVGASHLRIPGGQRFSQATLAAEAAVAGLGVAMARASLVEADLVAGWLVRPLPQSAPTAFAYHIVHPSAVLHNPRVARFCAWLIDEAGSGLL